MERDLLREVVFAASEIVLGVVCVTAQRSGAIAPDQHRNL